MGPLTPDSFLVILMVLALSAPEFRGVRDAVITGLASATIAAPYTATPIRSHLDLKQQVRNADICSMISYSPPVNDALAAHTRPSNKKFCTNCKKDRHMVDFYIQPGGKMAGQPLKNAWTAEKSSWPPKTDSTATTVNVMTPSPSMTPTTLQPPPKSGIMLCDDKGHVYMINPMSSKACPLQDNTNIVMSTNKAHFSGLLTDNIVDIVHSSMTPGDLTKYFKSERAVRSEGGVRIYK